MTVSSARRCRMLIAAVSLLLALSGCTGTESAALADGAVVEAPSLQPGAPVPAPREAVVLTLTGRIGARNQADALALDSTTLDRIGRIRATVFDPWIKQDLQVQGLWLTDLLRIAQADAATSVRLTALDDYEIDLSAADLRAGGILLATRTGTGTAIPINAGGPTRIVFVGDSAAGSRPELWIWSLRSIDVR